MDGILDISERRYYAQHILDARATSNSEQIRAATDVMYQYVTSSSFLSDRVRRSFAVSSLDLLFSSEQLHAIQEIRNTSAEVLLESILELEFDLPHAG